MNIFRSLLLIISLFSFIELKADVAPSSGIVFNNFDGCMFHLKDILKNKNSDSSHIDKLTTILDVNERSALDRVIFEMDLYNLSNEVNEFIKNTNPEHFRSFLRVLVGKHISTAEFVAVLRNPALENKLPEFSFILEVQRFLKVMNGEISTELKAFAHFYAKDFKHKHPLLSKKLNAVANSIDDTMELKTNKDGTVSFLWYPVYPEGSPSCTHTKVIVDGNVWSTMGA